MAFDPFFSKQLGYLVREVGRNRRGFYRVLIAGMLIFAFTQIFTRPLNAAYDLFFPALLLLFSFAFIIYDYLGPERARYRSILVEESKKIVESQESNVNRVIESVVQGVSSNLSVNTSGPPEERDAFLKKFVEELSKSLGEALSQVLQYDANHGSFVHQGTLIRSRLEEEIEAQARRGRVNLTIGAIFAAGGIAALATFALWFEYRDVYDLAVRFVPRLSFVILVEVFSYFFLNLYRHSIFEIKYFQNELTNMDGRLLALQGCLLAGDMKAIGKICEQISRIERNFILKKGENTVQGKETETMLTHQKNFAESIKDIMQTVLKNKDKG